MDNQLLQIQNRTCRIYGTASAEYLLLQMVDEHDLAGMEREVEAIRRQTAHLFLLAAVQVENWNDDLSPWPAPPVWGKQGFGGRAEDTLAWLEQAVPGISQQYSIKEDCKVILGGYSLAGLFALWAATQTNALYGTGGGFAVRVVSRLAGIRSGAPYSDPARLSQPWRSRGAHQKPDYGISR